MKGKNMVARRKRRRNRAHPFAVTLCVVLFALVGCNPVDNKDWRVRLAGLKTVTDQVTLSRVAVNDEEPLVRQAAVEKLTDQVILSKIAVEDQDSRIRIAAVGKLTDQATLAKIAIVDQEVSVRLAAAANLTDQSMIANLSMEAKDWDVRLAAVERLTEQPTLAKVALEDLNWRVRLTAIKNLTDQSILSKFALNANDMDARLAAAEKLTDQATLSKIAAEAKDWQVRLAIAKKISDTAEAKRITEEAMLAKIVAEEKLLPDRLWAIWKVTDQVLLQHWAEDEPQAVIRKAAVAQIRDDRFLIKRLKMENSPVVRTAIVDKLYGKDSLREAALTAYYRENRERALWRLKDELKDQALDVEIAHKALERRVKDLKNENDNSRLLALVMDGEFDIIQVAAAERLREPSLLEQACLIVTKRDVMKILLSKLDDNVILEKISTGAADSSMRLAAAQKSGAKSWKSIFDVATRAKNAPHLLGDALAAVALFPEVQNNAIIAVHNACLTMIRSADESRIPEMVDLLESYGDKMLVEDYLNSGQPDLELAGRNWASRRGYQIGTGAGSHRATWGNTKKGK